MRQDFARIFLAEMAVRMGLIFVLLLLMVAGTAAGYLLVDEAGGLRMLTTLGGLAVGFGVGVTVYAVGIRRFTGRSTS